jgi:hypothetical protein
MSHSGAESALTVMYSAADKSALQICVPLGGACNEQRKRKSDCAEVHLTVLITEQRVIFSAAGRCIRGYAS